MPFIVYSRKYVPNNLSSNQKEFFKQADNSFGYNSNFNQTFSVSFCSACHSKYEHIKKVKSNTTEIKQLESFLYNNNCDSELKFKLFVENETGNTLPRKVLRLNYRTGAMILQDNDDWKEFLKLYKSIITDKTICVYVTMNKQIKKRKQELMMDLNSEKSNEPKSKALFHSTNTFGLSGPPNTNNSFTSAIHSSKIVHKFFLELKVINNESGSYTQFERAFENEKITLDTIKELSESDLIELGVNKMGWRKKIMKLAREY
ncbi:22044_t:CDS:2 [Gigaspora rosea]|nr:22044_t:CDS:2 [Gigaspora rosea]